MVLTNLAGYVKALLPFKATALTAAGTGDNTEITGPAIDCFGYSSLILSIGWLTSLTADKTLSILVKYQSSQDNSNWDTAVTLQASTVVSTGAKTAEGAIQTTLALALADKKRYIKFLVTPDLSHSGTDTATVYGTAILGGAETLPAV